MAVLFNTFHTEPRVDRSMIDGELMLTMNGPDAEAWTRFMASKHSPYSVSVSDDGTVLGIRSGSNGGIDIRQSLTDVRGRMSALGLEVLRDGDQGQWNLFHAVELAFDGLVTDLGYDPIAIARREGSQ